MYCSWILSNKLQYNLYENKIIFKQKNRFENVDAQANTIAVDALDPYRTTSITAMVFTMYDKQLLTIHEKLHQMQIYLYSLPQKNSRKVLSCDGKILGLPWACGSTHK